MFRLLLLVFAFLWADSLVATPAEAEPFQGVSDLMSVMLSLVIVLVMVFLVAWVMRRMQGYGGSRGSGMKVIAQLPLSTRERLMLVEIGNEQILLGVSPGGIRTLHVLKEPLEAPSSDGEGVGFRERLMESLKRGGQVQ